MNERKGLEGLLAWQKSMEFAKRIYTDVIPLLPKEEKWVIGSQLRRAASSGVRFSYIARGSLEEILTFVTLAKDLNYLPVELFESLRVEVLEIKRIISGYIAYLKKSKPGQYEPGAEIGTGESRDAYLITTDEAEDIDA